MHPAADVAKSVAEDAVMSAQGGIGAAEQSEECGIYLGIYVTNEGIGERKGNARIVFADVRGVPRERGLKRGRGHGAGLKEPRSRAGRGKLHIRGAALCVQFTAYAQKLHRYGCASRHCLHYGKTIGVGGLATDHGIGPSF